MHRRSLALLLLAALAAPASAQAADGDIIVRRDPSLDGSESAELRDRAKVRLEASLPLPGTELVDPRGSVRKALEALERDPDVISAEPDGSVHALTNDSFWGDEWGLENTGQLVGDYYDDVHFTYQTGTPDADVDAPDAWLRSRGAGVTVAVADTGINSAQPEFAGKIDASLGYDWVDDDTTPEDQEGHGSHVAGTIAARAENGLGVAGVAPDASLAILRVLDANGDGYMSDVAAAFAYAGERGIRVVNASLGGGYSDYLGAVIASYPKTLYVVAAGNDGVSDDSPQTAEYPCSYPYANVICVGASDNRDQPAIFSNFGPLNVDLFAPGMGIVSTYKAPGQVYVDMSGTSMATPHVAGAAALALAANPALTTAQLRTALLTSVDRRASLAGLSATGGRLNADTAVQVAAATTPEPTPTPPPPPPAPTPVPTPVPPPPPPPAAKLTKVSVSGSLRTKKSRLRVRYSLTRAATVQVKVTKRGSKRALSIWTRDGRAGTNSFTLTRRLPTRLTLRPGAYTLSLKLSASARSATFRVR